jgi:DNA-binding MarR family transcriptional regulator
MVRSVTQREYEALARFRFLIRDFVNNTEGAVRSAGVEPQQYQALLAIRGMPLGNDPTVRSLAEHLQIRHHSAVELVNRMANNRLLRRESSPVDRRKVLLRVTNHGQAVLTSVARTRIAELRATGPRLLRALSALIRRGAEPPIKSVPRHTRRAAGLRSRKRAPDG